MANAYQSVTLQSKLRGFSLLECLLSITLGLIVTAVTCAFFSALNTQGLFIGAINDVELSGNLFQAIVQEELSQAGYAGCLPWTMRYPHSEPVIERVNVLPTQKSGHADNSDVLRVLRFAPLPNTMVLHVGSDYIDITTTQKLKPGQSLILNDCEKIQKVTIARTRRYRGILRVSVKPALRADWLTPTLSEYLALHFAVFTSGQKNASGSPEYALYRHTVRHGWQSIIPGIYQLVVDIEPHATAVSALVGSVDNVKFSKRDYQVGSHTFTPSDHRLYKVYPWLHTVS